jgi:hypothetical protein
MDTGRDDYLLLLDVDIICECDGSLDHRIHSEATNNTNRPHRLSLHLTEVPLTRKILFQLPIIPSLFQFLHLEAGTHMTHQCSPYQKYTNAVK